MHGRKQKVYGREVVGEHRDVRRHGSGESVCGGEELLHIQLGVSNALLLFGEEARQLRNAARRAVFMGDQDAVARVFRLKDLHVGKNAQVRGEITRA